MPILLLLLLPFLALLALAAPPLEPSPPLDLTTTTANPAPNLTATTRCAKSRDWQAYAFLVEDCFTAIQQVYIDEVVKKPAQQVYEFIAEGDYRKTSNPSVRTPAQYTVSQ